MSLRLAWSVKISPVFVDFLILYCVSLLFRSRIVMLMAAVLLCTATASFAAGGPSGRAVPNVKSSLGSFPGCCGIDCCARPCGEACPPAKKKGLPTLFPFTSNGGDGVIFRVAVIAVICGDGDFPLPNTKGSLAFSLLITGGGQGGDGGPCDHVVPNTQVLDGFSPSASGGSCGGRYGSGDYAALCVEIPFVFCHSVLSVLGDGFSVCCGFGSCAYFCCHGGDGGGSTGGDGFCGSGSL